MKNEQHTRTAPASAPAPTTGAPAPAAAALAPTKRSRRDLPAILALLVLAIFLGQSTVHRAAWSRTHRSDFTVYTAAAEAYLRGEDIYEAKNPRGWLYMYLPVFALAMVPFTFVSVAWAAGLWYALSVAMLAHALWLAADVARRCWPGSPLTRFQLALVALAGVLWPSWSGLMRGQASVLLTYLVTLAVWAMLRRRADGRGRRDWLAGGALAGAIVLKVFPLLFLPYLVLRRRWRLVLATCVWMLLLVFVLPGFAFGFRENTALLHRWVTTVAMATNQPDESETEARYAHMIDPRIERNQSLSAVMVRLLAPEDRLGDATGRENLAEAIAKGINGVLVLVTAWACLVARRPERAPPGERSGDGASDDGAPGAAPTDMDAELDRSRRTLVHCCLAIMLMLFVSPVSWVHSYALLALPLAVVAAAATSAADFRQRPINRWTCAYAMFLVGSVLALTIWPLRIWGALLWGTVALWLVFVTAPEARSRRRSRDRRGASGINAAAPLSTTPPGTTHVASTLALAAGAAVGCSHVAAALV